MGYETGFSRSIQLPPLEESEQGYNTVGWLSDGSICMVRGTGNGDDIGSDQDMKAVKD